MNPPLSDFTDAVVWVPQQAYPQGRWRTRHCSSKRKDNALVPRQQAESFSKVREVSPVEAPLD